MKSFVNLIVVVTALCAMRVAEAQDGIVGNPAAVRCVDSAPGASWDPAKTPHCQCPSGFVNSVTVGCPRDTNEYDTCVNTGWTPPASRVAPPPPASPPVPPAPPAVSIPQCNDKDDNDGDTWIDLRDPGCAGVTDKSEDGDKEFLGKSQCYDELDNDEDGLVDGQDSDCNSYADNLEGPEGDSLPAIPPLPPPPPAPAAPEPEEEEEDGTPVVREVVVPPPPPPPPPAAELRAPPSPLPSRERDEGEGDDDCNCYPTYHLESGVAARGFYGAPKWLKLGIILRPLVFSIEPAPDNHLVLSFGFVYAGDGVERPGAEATVAYRLFSWRHWGFGGELASTWVDFGVKRQNGDRVFTTKIWNVGATAGPTFRLSSEGSGLRFFAGYGLGWSVFAKERTENNFVLSASYAF